MKMEEDIVMCSVRNFIRTCRPDQREMMVQFLDESRRPYSLRLIEHFFLKYINTESIMDDEIFDTYEKYKRITSSYKKWLFDCFARGNELVLIEIDGRVYESTPGQLNFFCWYVENNFTPIIERHMEAITQQMKQERQRQRKRAAATLIAMKEQEDLVMVN